MGSFSFHLFSHSVLPWLVIILLLVSLLGYFRRQRADREKKNAELQRFSNLHLFSKALAESPDPKQMGDLTMQRTTEMLGTSHHNGNCVKVAALSPKPGEVGRDEGLLAYLDVAMKRMFSTDPGAFSQYRRSFERRLRGPEGESPSLLDTITALAFAVEAKNPKTQSHSQAVSKLAAQIATQMRLSEAEIEEIRLAGIVHDIGKIHVPEPLLYKPTLLTAEEYEIMKSHAAWGAKIVEPLKVKAIERIVRYHHERYDGTGYPEGLAGDKIPLGARIVAVAESFHNMVSTLPYRSARTFEDALAELRRYRGTQFDPMVVDAFLRSIESLSRQRPLAP